MEELDGGIGWRNKMEEWDGMEERFRMERWRNGMDEWDGRMG